MPLRPIDAIFVQPELRLYVVYYRGDLWQLPRMKIDMAAWQRRKPFTGNLHTLYLSNRQTIPDPILAQKLRTLNLPLAVRGNTLPRFEAWWETNGFEWLREKIATGESPLAAHQDDITEPDVTAPAPTSTPAPITTPTPVSSAPMTIDTSNQPETSANPTTVDNAAIITTPSPAASTDIFADMLAELASEVLNHRD